MMKKKVWKWVGIGISILTVIAVVVIGLVVYLDASAMIREARKIAIEPELIPSGTGGTIAYINVNVIPMDSERILEEQTVVVEDGKIVQIGSSEETSPPGDALIIDGKDHFLIPGLSDMHVHLLGSENDLLLYLANGVTTIRDQSDGPPEYLDWRDAMNAGTKTGPNMWVWSPSIRELEGFDAFSSMVPDAGMVDINNPGQAEKLIAKFADQGYDGIKVKFVDSVDIYKAILKSADKYGIKVDGHIPEDLWFGENKEIFKCEDREACWDEFISMDIEAVAHIEEALRSADRTTDKGILQAAQDIVKDGMWVTTTTFLLRSVEEQISNLESLLTKPEIDYLNPAHFRMGWLPEENTFSQLDPSYFSERYVTPHEKMLIALNEAGALLMSGTDTPLPIMVPGFALHGELAAMVDIGLSPYDALRTSTYNPAKYLGGLDEFGTIEVGKRADLVLLQANPLEDITNTQKIEGVMVRGKWFSRADLDTMLEEVAKANQK